MSVPFAGSEHVDVTLVSPRNYFLYSPLLPSASVGTVEQRSIVEPVRKMLGSKVGSLFLSSAHSPDLQRRTSLDVSDLTRVIFYIDLLML